MLREFVDLDLKSLEHIGLTDLGRYHARLKIVNPMKF